MTKFILGQVAVIFKQCIEWHNFNKIPYTYLVHILFIAINTYYRSFPSNWSQMSVRHKELKITLGLEQQIYASQEYFTQPMVVMVETFRRSGHGQKNPPIILEDSPWWLFHQQIGNCCPSLCPHCGLFQHIWSLFIIWFEPIGRGGKVPELPFSS